MIGRLLRSTVGKQTKGFGSGYGLTAFAGIELLVSDSGSNFCLTLGAELSHSMLRSLRIQYSIAKAFNTRPYSSVSSSLVNRTQMLLSKLQEFFFASSINSAWPKTLFFGSALRLLSQCLSWRWLLICYVHGYPMDSPWKQFNGLSLHWQRQLYGGVVGHFSFEAGSPSRPGISICLPYYPWVFEKYAIQLQNIHSIPYLQFEGKLVNKFKGSRFKGSRFKDSPKNNFSLKVSYKHGYHFG